MAEEDINLEQLAEEKIKLGQNLIAKLVNFNSIEGVAKIQRKINQELKFLQKVKSTGALKLSHVNCSNLTHYEFLVKVLEKQKQIVQVDCAINVESRPNPLRVDIICDGGAKWIKVIARNTKSLSDAAQGRASYGAKSILDQAEEYVSAAERNLFMFRAPKVVFQLCNSIDDDLKNSLEEIGVSVLMNLPIVKANNLTSANSSAVNLLNLDITTMLAYISALTNGSNSWIFNEPILNQQAAWEIECPVKSALDNLFEGKSLICCETALNSFKEIVALLGGPNETKRSEEFIKKLEIYEDIEVPEELMAINIGGKIKPRSLKIFAFGIAMKAITVTSNEGFIRSAKMKGINIPVHIIQARALTESKEKSATRKEFH